MTDYIKREDAIKAFDPLQRQDWYTPWIVETLKDLPSADVVPMERYKSMENTCVKLQKALADVAPVRYGLWYANEDSRIVCSECKHGAPYMYKISDKLVMQELTDYCPNYGARMDGDGNEID